MAYIYIYIKVVIFILLLFFAYSEILNFVLCGPRDMMFYFIISITISVSSTAITEILIHTFWRSLMVGLATNLIWVFYYRSAWNAVAV